VGTEKIRKLKCWDFHSLYSSPVIVNVMVTENVCCMRSSSSVYGPVGISSGRTAALGLLCYWPNLRRNMLLN
jgi:hypothetical protein